jgi:hypothetical protein
MSQQPDGRDGVLLTLDATIGDLDLAKETTRVTPAKDVFNSASVLLTIIRVRSLSVPYLRRLLTNVHRTR